MEAATIEAATLQARQHWTERQMVTRETEIDGPWQPIDPGAIARFAFDRHGVDLLTEVRSLGTTWDQRGSTRFRLRGVTP